MAINDASNTLAEWPLKTAGAMNDEDFKALGKETTLAGPQFTLSTLIQLHSASTTPLMAITPSTLCRVRILGI